MNFSEARFPEDISYGSKGGPEFSTEIVISKGGIEHRNANWLNTRSRYNVSHCIKSKSQLEKLISFFRAHKGRAIGFRFKDWTDYQAKNQLITVSDGKTQSFQLKKTYKVENGPTYDRKIYKPVEGTVKIFLDSEDCTNKFTIDHSTGMLHSTIYPEPDQQISADFEFDVPVRFDTDHLSSSIEDLNSFSWENITLIEIKP